MTDISGWVIRYKDGYSVPLATTYPKYRIDSLNEKRGSGTATVEYLHVCGRCGGQGGAEQWRYTGYTCFECGGRGKWLATKTVHIYTPERNAVLQAALEARQEKKRLERVAATQEEQARKDQARAVKFEAFQRDHGALYADLQELAPSSQWLKEMLWKIEQWGDLSERQIASAVDEIAKIRQARGSRWVGEIGKRVDLTLTTVNEIDLGVSQFSRAHTYLIIMHDDVGNVITYKGSSCALPAKGDTERVRVTISDHTTYRDVRQTVIARPKNLEPIQE